MSQMSKPESSCPTWIRLSRAVPSSQSHHAFREVRLRLLIRPLIARPRPRPRPPRNVGRKSKRLQGRWACQPGTAVRRLGVRCTTPARPGMNRRKRQPPRRPQQRRRRMSADSRPAKRSHDRRRSRNRTLRRHRRGPRQSSGSSSHRRSSRRGLVGGLWIPHLARRLRIGDEGGLTRRRQRRLLPRHSLPRPRMRQLQCRTGQQVGHGVCVRVLHRATVMEGAGGGWWWGGGVEYTFRLHVHAMAHAAKPQCGAAIMQCNSAVGYCASVDARALGRVTPVDLLTAHYPPRLRLP